MYPSHTHAAWRASVVSAVLALSLVMGLTACAQPAAPPVVLAQAEPSRSREGVDVGRNSAFAKLIQPDEIEAAATKQYNEMLRSAAEQKALAEYEKFNKQQRIESDFDRQVKKLLQKGSGGE